MEVKSCLRVSESLRIPEKRLAHIVGKEDGLPRVVQRHHVLMMSRTVFGEGGVVHAGSHP